MDCMKQEVTLRCGLYMEGMKVAIRFLAHTFAFVRHAKQRNCCPIAAGMHHAGALVALCGVRDGVK